MTFVRVAPDGLGRFVPVGLPVWPSCESLLSLCVGFGPFVPVGCGPLVPVACGPLVPFCGLVAPVAPDGFGPFVPVGLPV